MPGYRLDSIAQLARELEFTPQELRLRQLASAEDLLYLIDPAKAYPLDFLIYKITEYRPRTGGEQLLTGLALQHDLGMLVERVSEGLNLRSSAVNEPVLDIDDVCARFNVTSKTIQRWRRRGLCARRFIFPDGKRRVGFLLSSVERFLAVHGEQVAQTSNASRVGEEECGRIIERARRLARDCYYSVDDITWRLARSTGRSRLTILHTIRKHDQEHPDRAVFAKAAPPITEAERLAIFRASRQGQSLRELAARFGHARCVIYRIILEERSRRLSRRTIRFQDDPLFHQDDAQAVIEALEAQEELTDAPAPQELRVPRDLPPYLQELYRTPLLGRARERALFLKLNYHKYQFVCARRRMDPELVRHRELAAMERRLATIQEIKNQIVRANLRLVVSVAKRHVRPGVTLAELISEGNLILMRAVDGFDVGRGNRFSTYATLALMKGFARSVPQMLNAARNTIGDAEVLEALADVRPAYDEARMLERDQVRHLLDRLEERERRVLCAHFGLDGEQSPASYEEVGHRLGLSKERVRQIERRALAKLRAAAGVDGGNGEHDHD
jgi:RNA polymerase primary sigma factor